MGQSSLQGTRIQSCQSSVPQSQKNSVLIQAELQSAFSSLDVHHSCAHRASQHQTFMSYFYIFFSPFLLPVHRKLITIIKINVFFSLLFILNKQKLTNINALSATNRVANNP